VLQLMEKLDDHDDVQAALEFQYPDEAMAQMKLDKDEGGRIPGWHCHRPPTKSPSWLDLGGVNSGTSEYGGGIDLPGWPLVLTPTISSCLSLRNIGTVPMHASSPLTVVSNFRAGP